MSKIPKFRSEQDERDFWAERDSTEFIDWQAAQRRRFPNLKRSLRSALDRLLTRLAPSEPRP